MNIDINNPIPIADTSFQGVVIAFVFNCPSATITGKKKDKIKKYENVSTRNCSFRDRGITGTLLNTITSQIKRLMKNQLYRKVIKEKDGHEDKVEDVFNADLSAEKIVFRENSQMSDAETVYYYVRNAFAHGSFEIVDDGGVKIYK